MVFNDDGDLMWGSTLGDSSEMGIENSKLDDLYSIYRGSPLPDFNLECTTPPSSPLPLIAGSCSNQNEELNNTVVISEVKEEPADADVEMNLPLPHLDEDGILFAGSPFPTDYSYSNPEQEVIVDVVSDTVICEIKREVVELVKVKVEKITTEEQRMEAVLDINVPGGGETPNKVKGKRGRKRKQDFSQQMLRMESESNPHIHRPASNSMTVTVATETNSSQQNFPGFINKTENNQTSGTGLRNFEQSFTAPGRISIKNDAEAPRPPAPVACSSTTVTSMALMTTNAHQSSVPHFSGGYIKNEENGQPRAAGPRDFEQSFTAPGRISIKNDPEAFRPPPPVPNMGLTTNQRPVAHFSGYFGNQALPPAAFPPVIPFHTVSNYSSEAQARIANAIVDGRALIVFRNPVFAPPPPQPPQPQQQQLTTGPAPVPVPPRRERLGAKQIKTLQRMKREPTTRRASSQKKRKQPPLYQREESECKSPEERLRWLRAKNTKKHHDKVKEINKTFEEVLVNLLDDEGLREKLFSNKKQAALWKKAAGQFPLLEEEMMGHFKQWEKAHSEINMKHQQSLNVVQSMGKVSPTPLNLNRGF